MSFKELLSEFVKGIVYGFLVAIGVFGGITFMLMAYLTYNGYNAKSIMIPVCIGILYYGLLRVIVKVYKNGRLRSSRTSFGRIMED